MSHDLVRDLDDGDLERWDDPLRGTLGFRTLYSGDATPTSGLTVGVAELAAGEQLKAHRHAQPEVYLVVAGEGAVRLGDDELPVSVGSTVFLPGGEVHGVRNTGAALLRVFYVLAADGFPDVEYDFSPSADED